jgi:hypothetical protein
MAAPNASSSSARPLAEPGWKRAAEPGRVTQHIGNKGPSDLLGVAPRIGNAGQSTDGFGSSARRHACDQHRRRPAMEYLARQPISAVPRIRSCWIFSSRSAIRCVLLSRVGFLMEWRCACGSPQLAFGGDDHCRSEENDDGAEDQKSYYVRRRYHVSRELAIAASKLAWKIATSNTLLPVRL